MSETLPPCPACKSVYTYEMGALLVCPECAHEWTAEAERLQEFADKHQGYYLGVVGTRRNCRDHLLAILDSARVGAADTQPEALS